MAVKPISESTRSDLSYMLKEAEAQAIQRAHEALVCAEGKVRKGWTRGSFAANVKGKAVAATSAQAVAWCAMGAVQACTPRRSLREDRARHIANRALSGVAHERGASTVPSYNDSTTRTKAQVVSMFARARAMLKAVARENGVKL